tara:strand:+ start:931 stop:1548 length:618 start_codon:yes stop_codon:yes gene_type:complete
MKKNKFLKDKYLIIRNFVPKNISKFLFSYFVNKRTTAQHLFSTKYISPFEKIFGTFGDSQIKNKKTFCMYGDIAMDTLLYNSLSSLSKSIDMELFPTYSFGRIYSQGDELHKHKDRPSCEISGTINLGGDPWSIFLKDSDKKNIEIILKPGDILMYKGADLEHWRKPFIGKICAQVFLHYTTNKNKKNIYDGRPMLGLPPYFKSK